MRSISVGIPRSVTDKCGMSMFADVLRVLPSSGEALYGSLNPPRTDTGARWTSVSTPFVCKLSPGKGLSCCTITGASRNTFARTDSSMRKMNTASTLCTASVSFKGRSTSMCRTSGKPSWFASSAQYFIFGIRRWVVSTNAKFSGFNEYATFWIAFPEVDFTPAEIML